MHIRSTEFFCSQNWAKSAGFGFVPDYCRSSANSREENEKRQYICMYFWSEWV